MVMVSVFVGCVNIGICQLLANMFTLWVRGSCRELMPGALMQNWAICHYGAKFCIYLLILMFIQLLLLFLCETLFFLESVLVFLFHFDWSTYDRKAASINALLSM